MPLHTTFLFGKAKLPWILFVLQYISWPLTMSLCYCFLLNRKTSESSRKTYKWFFSVVETIYACTALQFAIKAFLSFKRSKTTTKSESLFRRNPGGRKKITVIVRNTAFLTKENNITYHIRHISLSLLYCPYQYWIYYNLEGLAT